MQEHGKTAKHCPYHEAVYTLTITSAYLLKAALKPIVANCKLEGLLLQMAH